jgi:hypothetical protein
MKVPFDVLPLVIGVTGHRDVPVEAEAPLRARFGEILERMQAQHRSMPLLVLSGLAAGADIFAAEEALDRGVAVLACLPMPQADYEKDFTPAERERFRRVLPRCWDIAVVGTSEQRGQDYVDVATFIAYYSHVLVAFWDGLEARGPGGTAQVVEFRAGGDPGLAGGALVANLPDAGPVFHIVTPRRDQLPPERCYSIIEIYPERLCPKKSSTTSPRPSAKQGFEDAISLLERFDADIALERKTGAPDRLAALALRTDAAANRLQARSLRSLQAVYIATGMAGAAQIALPADGSLHIPGWAGIAARIGFLAIAFVVFVLAKREDSENRYQDYRAIAEALRVQRAWCLAGMRHRLVESSYLQMQQNELDWIRLALRTAYLTAGVGADCRDGTPDHPEYVRWIDGQLGYYETAGKREEARLQGAHRAMLIAGVSGAVLSGAAALLAWSITHQWISAPALQGAAVLPLLTYWATVPAALGGMLAVLIRFYVQQRGFAENARRYQHMFVVFDGARRRLRDHAADRRRILELLGHEALAEHAAWLILHRDRPLTFVHT